MTVISNENDKQNANGLLAVFRSKLAAYVLGGFLVFLTGFFIIFGREAKTTGSWDYVMIYDDEFFYWAVANGISQTPPSDENPYFFEDMGKRMSLPWTTAIGIGMLAKWLHISVMNFFPLWHIGMPFVTWLAFFLCLWKVWKYPMGRSAALSMILMLTSLFLRGQTRVLLLRFSRPGDGLWLLLIWVSLVMNPMKNRIVQTALLSVMAFVAFWLQPFYALIAMTAMGFEAIYAAVQKNWKQVLSFVIVFLVLGLAGLTYRIYYLTHSAGASWIAYVMSTLVKDVVKEIHYPSIAVFVLVVLFVFLRKWWLKLSVTPVARLLLYTTLTDLLIANAPVLFPWFPINREFSVHRYYFFFFGMASVLGVFAETVPVLLENRWFRKLEWLVVGMCGLGLVGLHVNRSTYFILYPPPGLNESAKVTFLMTLDSAILFWAYFLAIFILVWAFYRLDKIRKLFDSKKFVLSTIGVMCITGYMFMPTHQNQWQEDYPYQKAHRWLQQNAKNYDVVLTVSPRHFQFDYLVLKTHLKSYYTIIGMVPFQPDRTDILYRANFYSLLLLGWLNKFELGGYRTIPEKLKHLKLDYILINRPSAFYQNIVEQLSPYVQKVYEDDRALVWKVIA